MAHENTTNQPTSQDDDKVFAEFGEANKILTDMVVLHSKGSDTLKKMKELTGRLGKYKTCDVHKNKAQIRKELSLLQTLGIEIKNNWDQEAILAGKLGSLMLGVGAPVDKHSPGMEVV